MSSVEGSYIWSKDEIVASQKFHFRSAARILFSIGRTLLALFLLVLVAMFVFLSAPDNPHGDSLLKVELFFGFLASILLLTPLINSWAFARQAKGNPYLDSRVEIKLDSGGFFTRSVMSEGTISWRGFVKAKIGKEGILLYPVKRLFHWIPAHAFSSPEDFTEACNLVRENIPSIKEI